MCMLKRLLSHFRCRFFFHFYKSIEDIKNFMSAARRIVHILVHIKESDFILFPQSLVCKDTADCYFFNWKDGICIGFFGAQAQYSSRIERSSVFGVAHKGKSEYCKEGE